MRSHQACPCSGFWPLTVPVLQIKSFGYTAEQSLLYGTPGGAVEVITLLLNGYLGDRYGQRILVGCTGLVASIVGMILIVGLPLSNNVGRLVGFYLTQSSAMPFVSLLSLISSNVAGYTKKTTVAALYLIGYCVGNIIGRATATSFFPFLTSNESVGPQVFRPKDAPRYVPAEITIIVCWFVCLVIMLYTWWYYQRENKRKAFIRASPDYVRLENQE